MHTWRGLGHITYTYYIEGYIGFYFPVCTQVAKLNLGHNLGRDTRTGHIKKL